MLSTDQASAMVSARDETRAWVVMIPGQQQSIVRRCSVEEMPILAAALGDSPETVIAHHLLQSGACNAWYVGDVRQPRAAVVQAHGFLEEPTVFGESADAIARIIPQISGWTTFCVPAIFARDLERPIANAASTLSLNTLEDVYHVLDADLPHIDLHPDVRLLTPDDGDLLEGMPIGSEPGNGQTIIAAAVIEGEIVSLAHTFAWSPLYVDIGVTTHEDWRGHGYATSAAALVARDIRARSLVPVWSCGAHNEPSLRIAARLGFRETSRKVYLIPNR